MKTGLRSVFLNLGRPFQPLLRPALKVPWTWIAVFACLLALTFRLARLEGWDEAFYVAQMSSVVGDGDLMLQDDLMAFENRTEASRLRTIVLVREDGSLLNMFGIGPAVIHSTYLWPKLRAGSSIDTSLRIALGLGSMVLMVILGLAIRSLLLHLGFGPATAGTCALATIFCSPLAVYGTRLYLNSHLPAAACAAVALLTLWLWGERGGASYAVLGGLSCGLAAIVRWQDALLAVTILPFLLIVARERHGHRLKAIGELALAATVFGITISIQAFAFLRQTSHMGIPQGEGYMRWLEPELRLLLLSPFHGLVPWTPAFGVGLAALPIAIARSHKGRTRLFLACIALFVALECYVSALPRDWWAGSSFGARRLSTLAAPAAIGLAFIAQSVRRRGVLAIALVMCFGWAVLVGSLFSVHVDDLSVAFTGSPAEENPTPSGLYPASVNFGALEYVRDGFSFVDPSRPSKRERAAGAAWCFVVTVCSAYLWCLVGARKVLRHTLAVASTCWVMAWAVAVWRTSSNAAADKIWREVCDGTAKPKDLDALPAEAAAAGRVVLGWKALRAGRLDEGREHLAHSRSKQFPPISLADLALLDETEVKHATW